MSAHPSSPQRRYWLDISFENKREKWTLHDDWEGRILDSFDDERDAFEALWELTESKPWWSHLSPQDLDPEQA